MTSRVVVKSLMVVVYTLADRNQIRFLVSGQWLMAYGLLWHPGRQRPTQSEPRGPRV